jgi:hypothetical protein
MQLGCGCGSGTLYTVGGGSPRRVLTLPAFCAGSFWASLHMGFWQALPDAGAVSRGETLGWLWIGAALGGSWVGVRLRPAFGLAN